MPRDAFVSDSWVQKVKRIFEIIWYFRDQHGADKRCLCARLVEIKKQRETVIMWYLRDKCGAVKWCPYAKLVEIKKQRGIEIYDTLETSTEWTRDASVPSLWK